MNMRFTIPCQRVSNINGFITAEGIIDYFFSDVFPSDNLAMAFLIGLEFSQFEVDSEKTVSVRFSAPDGEILGNAELSFKVPPPPLPDGRPCAALPMHFTFRAETPGTFEFKVLDTSGGKDAVLLGETSLPVCRKVPKLIAP